MHQSFSEQTPPTEPPRCMHKPACPESAREPKGRTPRQQARAIASESSTRGQPHRGLPHKQCGTHKALSTEAPCKRPRPGAAVGTVLSAEGCCAGNWIRWPERPTTGESCNRNVDVWFAACSGAGDLFMLLKAGTTQTQEDLSASEASRSGRQASALGARMPEAG